MASEKEATLILKIKEAGSAALDKVGSGIKMIGAAALAAGAAIAAFATLAVKNFREQEEATNRLNQAMVNAGTFTTDLRDRYIKLAESLQKVTTFGDEQIISAIANIQQQARGIVVTDQLTKATLDFAAAMKMDLNTASELVGKSIGTNTNALARYGIEIDTSASKSEKMEQVISKLNSKFQDQAAAAAQGLGSIDQLANAFSDFMENVGAEIAPTIGAMVKIFTDLFNKINEGTPLTAAFGAVFKNIAAGALAVKFALSEVGAAIGITLAAGVESLQAIVKGQFGKVKEISSLALQQMKAEHLANVETLNSELNMLEQAHLNQKEVNRQADLAREVAAKQQKRDIEIQDSADRAMRQMEEDMYIMSLQGQSYEQQLQLQMAYLDKKISNEQNARNKLALIQQKMETASQLQNIQYRKADEQLEQRTMQARVDVFSAGMNLIAAASADGSAAAFFAMKAAALAQAIVAMNLAAAQALAVPPAPNLALSGMAYAAGGLNIAAIAASTIKGAQKFAEGGIVKARPGGTLGIIGEAGRDEAVIPLENGRVPGMGGGGTIMINVYGGMLGDQASAREFAVAVDKELLKLRQANESVAFDGGLT